ncbi:exodeoxyribonuclease VII small subunit [bacterium]|nr:exodeoxyribonuclease VII small subunit [bacterium]
MPKKEEKEKSFEQLCSSLEETVSRLEDEQLPLEEAIRLFNAGVADAIEARKRLLASEEKVQKLVETLEGRFELHDLE